MNPVRAAKIPAVLAAQPAGGGQLDRAKASGGWKLLNPQQQSRLAALLSGNNPISAKAQAALAALGPKWEPMTPNAQQAWLSNLLTNPDFRPGFVREYAPGPPTNAPPAFTVGPTTHLPNSTFEGRPADMDNATAKFGNHSILFRWPAKLDKGLVQHDHNQIMQMVARLPAFLRQAVGIIGMAPFTNVKEEPGGKRMPVYMEAFPGIPNVDPPGIAIYAQTQLRDPRGLWVTLLHELGHLVIAHQLTGGALAAEWAAAQKSDIIGPSQYAGVSGGEYEAEVFALYMSTRGTPAFQEYQALFPKQFEVMGKAVKNLGG
jgi:hypothetical protein